MLETRTKTQIQSEWQVEVQDQRKIQTEGEVQAQVQVERLRPSGSGGHGRHAIVPAARYSENGPIGKSLFVLQPIILKTEAHCSESLFFHNKHFGITDLHTYV